MVVIICMLMSSCLVRVQMDGLLMQVAQVLAYPYRDRGSGKDLGTDS